MNSNSKTRNERQFYGTKSFWFRWTWGQVYGMWQPKEWCVSRRGHWLRKIGRLSFQFKMCFVRGATYCEEEQNTRNSPPRRSFTLLLSQTAISQFNSKTYEVLWSHLQAGPAPQFKFVRLQESHRWPNAKQCQASTNMNMISAGHLSHRKAGKRRQREAEDDGLDGKGKGRGQRHCRLLGLAGRRVAGRPYDNHHEQFSSHYCIQFFFATLLLGAIRTIIHILIQNPEGCQSNLSRIIRMNKTR